MFTHLQMKLHVDSHPVFQEFKELMESRKVSQSHCFAPKN